MLPVLQQITGSPMVKNLDVFLGPIQGSLGNWEISSASAWPFILKLQPNK